VRLSKTDTIGKNQETIITIGKPQKGGGIIMKGKKPRVKREQKKTGKFKRRKRKSSPDLGGEQ